MSKSRNAVEMLPCPFCGAIPTIEPWHSSVKTKKLVQCSSDSLRCAVWPSVSGETRKIAIMRWNTRAPEREENDAG